MKMQMMGGPYDGDVQDVPGTHSIDIEFCEPEFALEAMGDTPARRGHKVHRYRTDLAKRLVMYQGERVNYNGEEVKG